MPNAVDLPAALAMLLSDVSPRDIRVSVTAMSKRYRESYGVEGPSLTSRDTLGYAAYRLPATYAAIHAVLLEIVKLGANFRPRSLLDVGSGPGTAAWAARAVWPDLDRVTLLERDAKMIRLGVQLAELAQPSTEQKTVWERVDIAGQWETSMADIVTATYVLGEFSDVSRTDLTEKLWAHCRDVCVIVEPGTPAGYRTIRTASEQLEALGGHIIAPFPLEWSCLQSEDDWTHFSVRIPRTSLHRVVKDARLSYEDEKYCYVVATRQPVEGVAARVIRRPVVKGGHVRLTLCTSEGVRTPVISRSQGDVYRLAKKLQWGDGLSTDEALLLDFTK